MPEHTHNAEVDSCPCTWQPPRNECAAQGCVLCQTSLAEDLAADLPQQVYPRCSNEVEALVQLLGVFVLQLAAFKAHRDLHSTTICNKLSSQPGFGLQIMQLCGWAKFNFFSFNGGFSLFFCLKSLFFSQFVFILTIINDLTSWGFSL